MPTDTPPPPEGAPPPTATPPQPAVEHLRWCIDRVLDYVDAGDPDTALTSLMSDLHKYNGDQMLEQFDVLAIGRSVAGGRRAIEQTMTRLGLAKGSGWFMIIDPYGTLRELNDTPSIEAVDSHTGPEGHNSVGLARRAGDGLRGFVNDCGLVFPNKYPRNKVGAAMLTAAGANPQIYAGPIVFTGWDPLSPTSEVRPLTSAQRTSLRTLHAQILDALGIAPLPAGMPRETTTWATAIRRYADEMMTAPNPRLQFRSIP